jgi:hypothetical protein
VTVVAAAVALCAALASCNRRASAGRTQAPDQWQVKIVSNEEPVEPLIVSGTIY